MIISFYFSIYIKNYEFSIEGDTKDRFIWKPYIFRVISSNEQMAKYYGHWWAKTLNISWLEFTITKLSYTV